LLQNRQLSGHLRLANFHAIILADNIEMLTTGPDSFQIAVSAIDVVTTIFLLPKTFTTKLLILKSVLTHATDDARPSILVPWDNKRASGNQLMIQK
jgi:hypothetical protein